MYVQLFSMTCGYFGDSSKSWAVHVLNHFHWLSRIAHLLVPQVINFWSLVHHVSVDHLLPTSHQASWPEVVVTNWCAWGMVTEREELLMIDIAAIAIVIRQLIMQWNNLHCCYWQVMIIAMLCNCNFVIAAKEIIHCIIINLSITCFYSHCHNAMFCITIFGLYDIAWLILFINPLFLLSYYVSIACIYFIYTNPWMLICQYCVF